jgi:excisionase family DNA binding protein
VNPAAYDYVRAARDALHFGKLLDRWNQNLRRVAGYDVQYFAAVEPQRRGAPHAHYAIRGTLPRAVVKELTEATYVNVWWPTTETVVYDGTHLPVWDDEAAGYLDPTTGEPLLTWEEALDDLDADNDAQPRHSLRFGTQLDVKGVLAGSPQAEKAIGYLVKYLTKDLGDDLDQADEEDQPSDRTRRADHIARLVDALRHEPCSPSCPNWLRYGIQPKNPRPGMRPGSCRAKAHKPSHLGYGGRRVLVSRKWTAKDLRDHRPPLPAITPALPLRRRTSHRPMPREERARPMSTHDPLLTIDEAGDLLGTGPDLPRRLIADGILDHAGDGDDVRIPQSALISYVIGAENQHSDSATRSTTRAA